MPGLDHTQDKSSDAHIWPSSDKKDIKTSTEDAGELLVETSLAAEQVDVASQDPLDKRESDRSRLSAVEDLVTEFQDFEYPDRRPPTPLSAPKHQPGPKDRESDLIYNSASKDLPTHGNEQYIRFAQPNQSPAYIRYAPSVIHFERPMTPTETPSILYRTVPQGSSSSSLPVHSNQNTEDTPPPFQTTPEPSSEWLKEVAKSSHLQSPHPQSPARSIQILNPKSQWMPKSGTVKEAPRETPSAPYAASTVSAISESMDSVFSAESLETSATAFSRDSGFSVEQIQSATRVFVSILQEDGVLMPLYKPARENSRIGPKRLRRYICEAVKIYAENLKEEANDHLEFAASRLVHAKARYAARCIASGEESYKYSQDSVNDRNRATRNSEDSSEEETAERPVEEAEFRDLKAFRLFLTESDAYMILQAQIQAICTKNSMSSHNGPVIRDLKLATGATRNSQPPQSIRNPGEELLSDERFCQGKELKPIPATRSNIQRTWYAWQKDVHDLAGSLLLGSEWIFTAKAALFLLIDVIFLLTDDAFIAIGCLEPPLEVGWTRIRSECVSRYRYRIVTGLY
jgi:hypothetical protein